MFRILQKGRYEWDSAQIEAWALANGWSGDGARQLREVAAGVGARRRYQVAPGGWRDDILRVWRDRATERAARAPDEGE
jgi:hypothetical protein